MILSLNLRLDCLGCFFFNFRIDINASKRWSGGILPHPQLSNSTLINIIISLPEKPLLDTLN